MRRFSIFLAMTIVALLAFAGRASAQHTVALTGGGGMTTARLYPAQEMRPIWGVVTGGVSWRYYTAERFVGGIGVDLEYMQRGFSYSPDAYRHEDKKDYNYYTRKVNSLVVPMMWQPHFYLFKKHVRVYLEAGVTMTFNLSATYKNELTETAGRYKFKGIRDNIVEYGLAGGGGIDFLVKRIEFGFRARYYFGYSDMMRNRNKYYNNATDDTNANPFYLTPLRSPVDNLMISFRIGFRFKKEGFDEWFVKRKKREKNKEVFKFSLD
ncbi:MAG: PorT family protein [Alistipes sp.]|nr:PorT family protein [Alistipes sp.]